MARQIGVWGSAPGTELSSRLNGGFVVGRRGLLGVAVAAVLATVVLVVGQLGASAAPSLTVTPSTGLTDGQSVSVTGSGFAGSIGGITECNTAAGQPTVAVAGQQIPVGCSNPIPAIQNLTNGGVTNKPLPPPPRTNGPPGNRAATARQEGAPAAALFPCPPPAAPAPPGAGGGRAL